MTYDHDRIDRFATVALARLPSSRMRLYAALVTFRNSTTLTCWPSVQTLAAMTGLSSRSVKYALADLVAVGLIRRTFRGRGGNLYDFAKGAAHHFPDVPAPATKRPEVQPPIPMAMPDPVDNVEKWGKNGARKGQRFAPQTAEMGQRFAPPSEPVKIFEPDPPPVVGQSTHDRARDDDGNDGGIEPRNNDHAAPAPAEDPIAAEVAAAVEKIQRVYLAGVWPNHPLARRRVRLWLAAGWPRDQLGQYLAGKIASVAVRDPAAVVLAALKADPLPAPVVPDHARPLAWSADRDAKRQAAEQRNGAKNGTSAEPVRTGTLTGRPVTGADVFFSIGSRLGATRTPEDVLDPVESFPSDADVLDALEPVDVLGEPMTADDYADAYAATGTD